MSSPVIVPDLLPQDSPDHPLAPYFAPLRAERRAARVPARRQPRAVVTIVYNEPVFLPIGLAWYSRWYEPGEIFVLDNETTDGSTDRDGFVRIPVERGAVDHPWMVRALEEQQRDLFRQGFHSVLVTDVDEIVTPVPEWGTLGEYLDGFAEPFVNCLGYELLHDRSAEPPLDLGRPILEQRGQWFSNAGYDKACLATEPMRWRTGLHGRADHALKPDPDLRLIHLHRMDFDLCLERHRTRSTRPWADEDARRGWAAHNRIVDAEAFTRWFDEDSGFKGYPIKREVLRPTWRALF